MKRCNIWPESLIICWLWIYCDGQRNIFCDTAAPQLSLMQVCACQNVLFVGMSGLSAKLQMWPFEFNGLSSLSLNSSSPFELSRLCYPTRWVKWLRDIHTTTRFVLGHCSPRSALRLHLSILLTCGIRINKTSHNLRERCRLFHFVAFERSKLHLVEQTATKWDFRLSDGLRLGIWSCLIPVSSFNWCKIPSLFTPELPWAGPVNFSVWWWGWLRLDSGMQDLRKQASAQGKKLWLQWIRLEILTSGNQIILVDVLCTV